MAELTTREFTAAGVRSIALEAGPRDAAEAVVFVHGNPGSGRDFARLVPLVGDFARAVAPDMPGYGKAERPADFDYTVDGYARHLGATLDALGVRRAHLALHDFGGPWGLTWAAANPDRVASVTLFNIGVLPGYRWHKFARIWRTPIVGELFQIMTTKGALRMLLNADNPKPFPADFIDGTYELLDPGMKRAVLKLYRATDDLGAVTVAAGDALAPRKLPALVVWGEGDKYLPVTYAETQKRYFDAEVHVVPAAGHWPMVDEPARVAELVVPFLRRHAQRHGHVHAPGPS